MKLSIIIPAYKVGPYIEKCIDSLQNQNVSKSDYEIIVTNDGSPDNISIIVKELQKRFYNLVLIDQNNQGVSIARNNAIKIARGRYIMPIDPDDYVETQTFKHIFTHIDNFDPDCLFLKMQKIDFQNKIVWQTDFKDYSGQLLYSLEPFHQTKGENQQLADPDRSVAILFKKSIIQEFNIYYPKDVPFLEDGIFVSKFLSVSRNYMLLDGNFYWRTIRQGSATNSNLFFSEKGRKGYFSGLDDLYEFLSLNKENIVDKKREAILRQMYLHFCILPIIAAVHSKNMNVFKNQVQLLSKKVKKIDLKNLRYPYNIYGKAFFISPYLFSFTYLLRTFSQALIRKFK